LSKDETHGGDDGGQMVIKCSILGKEKEKNKMHRLKAKV
jgi:hypothetical protein